MAVDVAINNPEQQKADLTEVGEFDKDTEGYFVIAPLPDEVKSQIYDLQDSLEASLPPDCMWLPKGDQLHITFAHIVSPDTAYEEPRDALFEQVEPAARDALASIGAALKGTSISFDEVIAFNAAIILRGYDDGSMESARQQFSQAVPLAAGTRKPPAIIHTTIARFREPIKMSTVRSAVTDLSPSIDFKVSGLQLVKEHQMYTQSHTVMEDF